MEIRGFFLYTPIKPWDGCRTLLAQSICAEEIRNSKLEIRSKFQCSNVQKPKMCRNGTGWQVAEDFVLNIGISSLIRISNFELHPEKTAAKKVSGIPQGLPPPQSLGLRAHLQYDRGSIGWNLDRRTLWRRTRKCGERWRF